MYRLVAGSRTGLKRKRIQEVGTEESASKKSIYSRYLII